MTTLADLRSQYPVFKDKGDFDIVRMLSDELQQPLDYTAYQLGLPPGDYVQNTGFGGDTATDLAVGASQIPGTVAGLADLANPFAYIPETNNITLSKGVDWAEKGLGIPDWRNRQQAMLSPERQAQDQAIRDKFAEGDYAGGAWEAVTSPRSVAGAAIQSVPLSLLGGALGRGVAAAADVAKLARLKKVAPWVGEGAVSTGAQVDQLTQQGVDPATANLAGLAAGAGVGAVGGSLGLAGRSVGIDDLEAWLGGAGRLSEGTKPVSLLPRIGGSAALETLQEVPQSAWEQATQNVATGDPLGKDVAYQALMGGLSGATMGGAFGVMPRGARPAPPPPPALTPEDTQAPPPPAPDLNQAAPTPAPTPPAAAAKPPTPVPGVSPDQLSDFERGLLGSLGANTGNPDFTALNPDGTVKGWVVDALRQASTNTPEQLKRKINSKSGIILKPLWQAAYDEKQKLKATPPKPTANTDTSETEQALIAKLPANKIRQGDGQPHQGALKLVQKIASMSSEELEAAKNTPMPLWHIPLYDHMIAIREAEQEQVKPESPAGPTSQEADLKTAQNPTPPVVADQELTPAPTPPVIATQDPTPIPIEVPDAQAVPPTPQASQTSSSPKIPIPVVEPFVPTPTPQLDPELKAKALSGQRLQGWELDDVLRSLVPDVLRNELAARAGKWIKAVPDLSPEDQTDPVKVAEHDQAVANRERRMEALHQAIVEAMAKSRGLGSYSDKVSFDEIAADFIQRDAHGAPIVGPDGKPLGLMDVRQGTKDSLWTHTTIRDIDTVIRKALEARGVNFTTKEDVPSRISESPNAEVNDALYNNGAINDAVPSRVGSDSGEVNPNDEQADTVSETPRAKKKKKGRSEQGDATDKAADPWGGEFEFDNADTKYAGDGGANSAAGNKITGNIVKKWAELAGYDVEGDPPKAKAQALEDLKKLPPLARELWAGSTEEWLKPAKGQEAEAATNLKALFASLREFKPEELRVGRISTPITRTEAGKVQQMGGKLVVDLYNAATQKLEGAPPFTELTPEEMGLFRHAAGMSAPDGKRLEFLRTTVKDIIEGRANAILNPRPTTATAPTQGDTGSPTGEAPTGAEVRTEAGSPEAGADNPVPDIVVGDKPLAGVQVKSKPKRRVATPEVQQGQDKAEVANPTTKEQFEKAVSSVLSKGSNWRLHVYQNLDEALADTSLGNTPREIGNAYGWAKDIKGVKHAFFILDRIQQGTELGKFLHEVGAHLGIENILTKAELNNLYDKIKEWALQADTSLESQIAMAAMARVDAAQSEREKTGRESDQYTMDDVVREAIAYFVESAVTQFGVDPFALQATTALGSWFRRLWNGFKRALRKVRLTNLDTLEPQHLVDLAYGAARLELATHWHGTAAKFRQFNHAYMGSGEGAQAYGWGTYLAARFGIGKGYMEADVWRKTPVVGTPPRIEINGEDWNKIKRDALVAWHAGDSGDPRIISQLSKFVDNALSSGATTINELVDSAVREYTQHMHRYGNSTLVVRRREEAAAWFDELRRTARLFRSEPPKPIEGALYRVDVNVQPDEVMHWDLPLSEQPKKVQEALNKVSNGERGGYRAIHVPEMGWVMTGDDPTGRELYARMVAIEDRGEGSERWWGSYASTPSEDVSMFLDSIGIKGMEHWDRPSRNYETAVLTKDGHIAKLDGPDPRTSQSFINGFNSLAEAIAEARDQGITRVVDTLLLWEKHGYKLGPPPNRSTNLVVFNDKNIFRVANAVGGDTSPGKVQYGFNAPEHLTAIQSAVTDQIKDTYSHATKRGILGWMSVDQLADRFGKDLPMVKTIAKTLGEMSAQSKHWLDRADHTVRMWNLLTPKQKEVMHNIMSQATLNGYDPEDATTVATKPIEKQLDQWWSQLKALDATAKVKAVPVYLAARKHFQDDLVEADAYLTKLQASATGKQATSINHLVAAIRTLSKNRKGVYFPLLRLGEFYSVGMSQKLYALHEKKLAEEDAGRSLNPADQVLYDKMRKDPKAYIVQGHESEARAARAVRKYEAQGMVAASNIMRFVSSKARAAITPEMEKFQKILADLGVQGAIASNLEQSYEHLLISNLPEGHALKQQLHREGIYGWNEDMMQSFAKATQARAFALSRLLHVRDLQEQMGELDAYSTFGRNPPDKAQMARDVLNELKRQQDLAYTRTSDPVFVRFATGWNYYAMLGASPAFWLLNLSQVPVITLPWLAARNQNRYGATIKALATGAKQIYQMVSISFENGELRSELDPTKNVPGITADEHRMLQDLKERGKLEFTIGMDIGAIAEGEYGAISKLKRSLNTPTNVTELINRGSTALAAYRISRKNGHTHDQAVEFADEAVGKTHMNYDPANTARNLKTIMGIPGTQAFAKIAFQFWKFQQGMAYLTLSTMKDAFNHPDPAVRKTARDTAIGMTLTLSATAGAFGLPFMGWGLGLLTQLFKAGPDDRDPDAERMIKNWLHDYMPWAENYLTKGVWGLLPQGINPDFSSRFSTANLMNPLAYARYDSTDRGEDVVKETLFRTFGGATATSAGAVYDGIKALLDGDMLKATEKLVPLKFLKDMARAAALGTKGLQTGTGEQRLDPGDFTATDEIWQLMGVTPMKKSLYYDRTKAIQGAMQPVNDVRTKLLSEYGQTRAQGGDVSKAVQEITKFNIRNPQARITTENMKQAYQRRQKNQQSTDSFGVLLDKRTSPYAQNARWAG